MTRYTADLAGLCGRRWGVSGSSSEEIVEKTVKHASEAHRAKEVPPEIAKNLKAAIRASM